MSKLFKKLKAGLEDVVAHQKGKINLRSSFFQIPEPPANYKPKDIKEIREDKNYSQNVFAKILNVSVRTVQSWESGQRSPSHSALRLLEIIDKNIYSPEVYKKN